MGEIHSNAVIVSDALIMLERAIKAIRTNNFADLERISNETIHNASIFQDTVSKKLAIIVLSIFKLEQQNVLAGKVTNLKSFAVDLAQLHDNLQHEQTDTCYKALDYILAKLKKISSSTSIHNVVNRAEVKKSGKIYDHGISLAQSAQIMGISQWELYDYIGKSTLNNSSDDMDARVKKRVAYTRSLFT